MYCDLFFFKQKTAYEMRISDWSSDVCSSDLRGFAELLVGAAVARAEETADSLARFEEIGGVGGDEADRARKPVAAIERRRRAAQDLDRLDEAEIDIVAASRRLRAEAETVGNAHAVDRKSTRLNSSH